jgi:hypothetical protein
MSNTFGERYQAGQVLLLQDYEGKVTTQAVVLDYDPTYDMWISFGSSALMRPPANHWHVAVREPHTAEWLPAAIWERGGEYGTFGPHITQLHDKAEFFREPLIYSTFELEQKIASIALDVEHIAQINS